VTERCRGLVAEPQQQKFEHFAAILKAWYHFSYHTNLEELKEAFDVDSQNFATKLDKIAQAANFRKIKRADLDRALQEESVFRLRLAVNFGDFDEIVFYRRGTSTQSAEIPQWFGLRKQTIEFTNFEHVLVFVRFKKAQDLDGKAARPFTPGSSMLKLFTNVPEADLEMLFPNTQVRMRLVDKLFIGIPAFVSGIIVLSTKIGGTVLILMGVFSFWLGVSNTPVKIDQAGLVVLLTGAGAIGAYLWKQYNSFKNRKIRFMKALTENLYFKTLANDSGVLSYLVDRAEESEHKEVLLAYTKLVALGPMTEAQLLEAVQTIIGQHVQFDMPDALQKLRALNIIEERDQTLTAVPLEQAYKLIDAAWDRAFE